MFRLIQMKHATYSLSTVTHIKRNIPLTLSTVTHIKRNIPLTLYPLLLILNETVSGMFRLI
jgi:predicted metal-dependent RNase